MDDYRIDSLEELRETEWMRMLWDAVKDELQERSFWCRRLEESAQSRMVRICMRGTEQ